MDDLLTYEVLRSVLGWQCWLVNPASRQRVRTAGPLRAKRWRAEEDCIRLRLRAQDLDKVAAIRLVPGMCAECGRDVFVVEEDHRYPLLRTNRNDPGVQPVTASGLLEACPCGADWLDHEVR